MSHGATPAAAMRREAQTVRAIDKGEHAPLAAATTLHGEVAEVGSDTSHGAYSDDRRIDADSALNNFAAPPTAYPIPSAPAAEDTTLAPSRDAANAQTGIANAAAPTAMHQLLAGGPAALPWAMPGEGTHRPALEPLARSGERVQTAAVQERRGPDRPVLPRSPGLPGDDPRVRPEPKAAFAMPADEREAAAPDSAPPPVASAPARAEAAAVASAGAAPVAAAARTAEADIAAPAGSAQFREAFVLQVSAFARDGVQNAQLHLNPAEMGPISVQIALDGQHAHIHFGSDSQATRALVEASLPALAAALREEGLTLSGGGVSQHAPNRQFDAPSESGASARHKVPDAAQPAAATRRVALGRLDTYA